jgi:uncharacterized protein YeaO (DUF488 family)
MPMRQRSPRHAVNLKRAYQPPAPGDGTRVLVDRLWPRGLRKADAAIDRWMKDVAPSPTLRTWFHHDPARWPEFRRRYAAELRAGPAGLAELRALTRRKAVTLVFAARDEQHTHALVLRDVVLDGLRKSSADGR